MTSTAIVVTLQPDGVPAGLAITSPEELASRTEPVDLLAVDASMPRDVVLEVIDERSTHELVIWWRSDASPSLSTDDILRLGQPLVFDLLALETQEVPAGRRIPVHLRAENAPTAEFVTLLGTPSARATLADVTRAVAAMRRPTALPVWDPLGAAVDGGTVNLTKVVDAWRMDGDRLVNLERPALASLLKRANKQGMDRVAAHLDGLEASGYRIPPATLILGETGTGKTVLARRLHEALYPDDHEVRRLVEVSAPTIRGASFTSEFFGHTEEAWTGTGYAIGPALEAAFGTLFIDEVGDLDARSQQSLLTFLVRRRTRLQGAESELFLPGHVLAATNRPLDQMVQAGTFRQDLYNRFPLVVNLRPLHERLAGAGDGERLITEVLSDRDVNPVLERGSRRGEPTISAIHEAAIAALTAHDYRTGNFRELIDILRRGVQRSAEERCEVLLERHLLFPPQVVEARRGDPIRLARPLADTITLLDRAVIEVEPDELTRLADRLGVSLLVTADDRRLVLTNGFAWADGPIA